MSALDRLRKMKQAIFGKKEEEPSERIDGEPVMYGDLKVERIVSTREKEYYEPYMLGVKITNKNGEVFEVRGRKIRINSEDGNCDQSFMKIVYHDKELDNVNAYWKGYAVVLSHPSSVVKESPFGIIYDIADKEAKKYIAECNSRAEEREAAKEKAEADRENAQRAREKELCDRLLGR